MGIGLTSQTHLTKTKLLSVAVFSSSPLYIPCLSPSEINLKCKCRDCGSYASKSFTFVIIRLDDLISWSFSSKNFFAEPKIKIELHNNNDIE